MCVQNYAKLGCEIKKLGCGIKCGSCWMYSSGSFLCCS